MSPILKLPDTPGDAKKKDCQRTNQKPSSKLQEGAVFPIGTGNLGFADGSGKRILTLKPYEWKRCPAIFLEGFNAESVWGVTLAPSSGDVGEKPRECGCHPFQLVQYGQWENLSKLKQVVQKLFEPKIGPRTLLPGPSQRL